MVLSNRRLKKKLRSLLVESLAAEQSGKPPQDAAKAEDISLQVQSLKELLGSRNQKPRLSKREKGRKKQSFSEDSKPVEVSEETHKESKENGGLIGLNKKRKREGDPVAESAGEGTGESLKKQKKREKREQRRKKPSLSEDSIPVEVSGEAHKESKENGGSFGLNKKRNGEGDAAASAGDGTPKSLKKQKKQQKKKDKKKKKKDKEEGKKKGHESADGESNERRAVEPTKIGGSEENADCAKKVYVGGIPYYSTEDDIRSFFDGCGTVTEVDCMRFPESGKFRGIAILTFKTEAAARRALALDGADMGGLYLKIQPYKGTRSHKSDFAPEVVDGYNRIYVGNLSWDITEDELRKFFSDCNVSSIRFGEDKTTGEFKGYAHVDFTDSLSLAIALKLDQKVVCGRPVKISCAVPKKEMGKESSSKPMGKATESGASSGNAKKKRRTCYECGVPGHLSSSCPQKKADETINSKGGS